MIEGAVLRVLSGRLAGTEKPLPPGTTVSIGHEFWQDVVIRDPATKGIAVDLGLAEDGAGRLTVLSGEASLLGSRLEAGQAGVLPPYVPFSIGGVALAWGEPSSARWSETGGLVRADQAVEPEAKTEPPPQDSVAEQAAQMIDRASSGLGAAITRKRLLIAAGVVALLLLALGFMPLVDALGLRGTPEARVSHALAAQGLSTLTASPGADGVTIGGVVATEAERGRARDALRDSGVAGKVDVQTSAELAQAAVDVARIHDVQATGRSIGRTAVELRTPPLDDDARTKLIAAIRADVHQVGRITVRDDLPPPDEAPLKTVADATKKVSTVVSGDPSYIQTVDGARYFPGAMMPSGHRLVSIQDNIVVLEKNGRETRLRF